jgi:hypothetical protein
MEPDTQATETEDTATPSGGSGTLDTADSGTLDAGGSDAGETESGPSVGVRPATTTRPLEHPGLGSATAILDDRAKTRRELLIGIACAAVGLLGVSMGIGDTTSGDGLGALFGVGGLVLVLYGLNQIRVFAARMVRPVRLVVAERGFDFPSSPGPIAWDEVATIAFEDARGEEEPSALQARVRKPEEFAERHALTDRARIRLLRRDGWIAIGGGMAMPLEEVLRMMKERLAEAHGNGRAGQTPAAAARARTGRTSRH